MIRSLSEAVERASCWLWYCAVCWRAAVFVQALAKSCSGVNMSGKVVPCRFDGKPCGRKSARGEPLCWEMWVIAGGRRKHIPRCPRVYTEEEMLEMEAEEAREMEEAEEEFKRWSS